MRFFICAFALVFALSACHTPHKPQSFSPTPDETRLVDLIEQRLDLAKKVAWTKYLDNLPVYDPAREAEILAHLTARANRHALPAPQVQSFFRAQMKASRQYQSILLHKWNRGNRLPVTPLLDLRQDIRPQLDMLNAELLTALAKLRPSKTRAAQLSAYTLSILRTQGLPLLPAHTAANSIRQLQ